MCLDCGTDPCIHTVSGDCDASTHASMCAAFELSIDGIAITYRKGTIRYVNPAFAAMTGYQAEELAGQNMSVLKSGQQTEQFYRIIWEAISSGQVWEGELVNQTAALHSTLIRSSSLLCVLLD